MLLGLPKEAQAPHAFCEASYAVVRGAQILLTTFSCLFLILTRLQLMVVHWPGNNITHARFVQMMGLS